MASQLHCSYQWKPHRGGKFNDYVNIFIEIHDGKMLKEKRYEWLQIHLRH